jgi:hypothetical protein
MDDMSEQKNIILKNMLLSKNSMNATYRRNGGATLVSTIN